MAGLASEWEEMAVCCALVKVLAVKWSSGSSELPTEFGDKPLLVTCSNFKRSGLKADVDHSLLAYM